MIAIIRCRTFCLPGFYPNFKDQDIQNYNFACFFCMGLKLGLDIEGGKEAEGV